MGMLQSIFCTLSFCLERVLTWTLCSLLLMLLMFAVVILMTYGIAAGYHYAQKELAAFARESRTTTPKGLRAGAADMPVVRLVAVNKSESQVPHPHVEVFAARTPAEQMYMDTTKSGLLILENDKRPAKKLELSDEERALARRLIGRFRRSRNSSTTQFYRMLNSTEPVILSA